MNRLSSRAIVFALSAALLCGCESGTVRGAVSENLSETYSAVTETPVITTTTVDTENRVPVTFAEKEREKKTVSETSAETEARPPLAENQIDYEDKNFYLVAEFLGKESAEYYPKLLHYPRTSSDSCVLHTKFTITNLSGKSFDFIPQKLIIYGRQDKNREAMSPVTARDTGLIASDGFYTVGAGETVGIEIDFAGDEVCADYPYRLYYNVDGMREPNNVSADEVNNPYAVSFDITDRNALKKAARAGCEENAAKNETAPEPLTPKEGEYSVLTHKNSVCFTAETVDGGEYVKVALRLQCLTGEPEFFNPRRFYLGKSDGRKFYARKWSLDETLTEKLEEAEYGINGVSETLYEEPFWEVGVRPDGTAEYTMYFSARPDEIDKIYKFAYDDTEDGGGEKFECIINLKEEQND